MTAGSHAYGGPVEWLNPFWSGFCLCRNELMRLYSNTLIPGSLSPAGIGKACCTASSEFF